MTNGLADRTAAHNRVDDPTTIGQRGVPLNKTK